MTPRFALLLVAIAQTARARKATLAAIASNGDYANRLYVGRRRSPAGWGSLIYRFMIGAETTVIVLLLWVAAASRAPAVGCRGGNIKISI